MSCSVPVIDLCIVQGQTYEKDFVWKSGGSVVNLTGYSAEASFRTHIDDTGTVLHASTANGLMQIEVAEGRYGFRFTPAITAALTRCVYDLFLISPTGKRIPQQKGVAHVSKAVTRSE